MKTPTPLTVRTAEPAADTIVFELAGALQGDREGRAFEDGLRAATAGHRVVVIDLARIERLDSCGFGILVAGLVSATNAGGRLGLAAVPERVLALLRAMCVLDLMVHAPSVDDVLVKLKGKHA